jgi:hypothetical protein
MLDPQLYQSRALAAEKISPVPPHGDRGEADASYSADPRDELGKTVE